MKTYTITLTIEQLTGIVNALAKFPFEQVAGLITTIETQMQQHAATETAPDSKEE